MLVLTVNSEIFARVIFSRNFAYAKFRENIIVAKWRNHSMSFTDIGKSCLSRELLTSQICLLKLFAKIKFYQKFPHLQYHIYVNASFSV